jgi:Tol biopolymer transport system component
MKTLAITLAAVAMAFALIGCGSDNASPLISYIARAQSDSTPHLFTLNESTKQSTAVNIPIPATAGYISANSTATAVIYYRSDDTNYDVFLMGMDGKEIQLTTGAAAWASVFSPDGKSIAYVASNSEQIFTMKANGTNQQPLYAAGSGIVYQYAPEFSPDGKSLVFYIQTNNCNQCLIQSGLGHRGLPPAVQGFSKAALHNPVQAQAGTPTQSGWYTMALTDATPTLVYATDSFWGPAVYSGDGTKLLISGYDGTEWNIFSVKLDGTGATPLTTGIVALSASPVPYKNLILYNVFNNSESDIYVMDQTGANQTLVITTANTYESLIDSFWEGY